MLFNITHLFIVLSILVLLFIKTEFPWHVYTFVLILLCTQLYLVYSDFNRKVEEFDATSAGAQDASGALALHPLDTSALTKLTTIPDKIKFHVNEGLDDLISVGKNKDNYIQVDPNDKTNTQYADKSVRLAYKHIDYLLAKIKLFDLGIYNALVPGGPAPAPDTSQQDNSGGDMG